MERSFILGEISPQINKIQVVSLTRPPTFFSFPFHISHDDQRDPNCWRKASILLLQHLSPFTRTRFLALNSYLPTFLFPHPFPSPLTLLFPSSSPRPPSSLFPHQLVPAILPSSSPLLAPHSRLPA